MRCVRPATQKPDGINTILTQLGENLTRIEEAEEVTQHYLDVLDESQAAGLDAQISVKPTQLGLDLDRALCERNLRSRWSSAPSSAATSSGSTWRARRTSIRRSSFSAAARAKIGARSASPCRPTSIARPRTSNP